MSAKPDDDHPTAGRLETLSGVLDALQCGAALIDADARLLHVNERLAAMAGRSAAALRGRSLLELYRDEAARSRLREALLSGEEGREREFYLPTDQGGERPVRISARRVTPAIDGPDGRDCRVVTVIDMAPLSEAYDEVARLSDTVLEQAMALKHRAADLEQRVAERTRQLREANMASITMLAVASEARDDDTGSHVRRIDAYSRILARRLGLTDAEVDEIGHSAILHDVGKIQVPDDILKKPGPLTDAERARMQQHTLIGEAILSDGAFFDTARRIARHHHENWDGSGYPDRIAGEAIALPARIVHVVDVYDALRSPRVYKPAWSPQEAVEAIQAERGRQFDPELVAAFIAAFDAGELAEVEAQPECRR
jgi:PAS domain S-box-containing protein